MLKWEDNKNLDIIEYLCSREGKVGGGGKRFLMIWKLKIGTLITPVLTQKIFIKRQLFHA